MASRQTAVNGSGINGRYPLQFRFWLNANNQDELALADEIEFLKSERRFKPTIRDGIRLVLDLRAGKTDVLFELFPWVKNLVLAAAIPADAPISHAAPPPRDFQIQDLDLKITATKDPDAGKKARDNFLRCMANLNPIEKKPAAGDGLRKLAGAEKVLAAPNFDDLDLEVF